MISIAELWLRPNLLHGEKNANYTKVFKGQRKLHENYTEDYNDLKLL